VKKRKLLSSSLSAVIGPNALIGPMANMGTSAYNYVCYECKGLFESEEIIEASKLGNLEIYCKSCYRDITIENLFEDIDQSKSK
jgi:hypothetical protein